MSKIVGLRGETLPEAPATPGITRYLAFGGEDHLVVRLKAAPGAVTACHHHGDNEVYGYIVSGAESFEFEPQVEDSVLVKQGDFFHIPAHTIHRDVNPSPNRWQGAALFFRGSGPVVVNVDVPEQA